MPAETNHWFPGYKRTDKLMARYGFTRDKRSRQDGGAILYTKLVDDELIGIAVFWWSNFKVAAEKGYSPCKLVFAVQPDGDQNDVTNVLNGERFEIGFNGADDWDSVPGKMDEILASAFAKRAKLRKSE